ncbi:MAG TPA: GUN4 domain-containing protein [Nostocaceae cyanobacterium]|nr:GUN4 domain-containing protein [Nostocaceae cyanobacterium]
MRQELQQILGLRKEDTIAIEKQVSIKIAADKQHLQQYKQELTEALQMWVKYSNGRFGFTVQKPIWDSLKSTSNLEVKSEQFGQLVGWYNKITGKWLPIVDIQNPTANTDVTKGHFPTVRCHSHI